MVFQLIQLYFFYIIQGLSVALTAQQTAWVGRASTQVLHKECVPVLLSYKEINMSQHDILSSPKIGGFPHREH